MMGLFKRYWWVPAGSTNEKDVPTLLSSNKVDYRMYKVIDAQTLELVGWTFEFSCIPVKYHALRMIVSGGNNFAPLEILLGTK